MQTPQTTCDIDVRFHGSLFVVQPLTNAARKWVNANVQLESWQWFGRGFCVEPRYLDQLLNGMCESGLRLRSDFEHPQFSP
mgnify:CR=1 FL=1